MHGTTEMGRLQDRIGDFLDCTQDRGLSPHTVKAFRSDLRSLSSWMRAQDIHPTTLPELDQAMRKFLNAHRQDQAPRTTERHLTTFRGFGRFLGDPTMLSDYKAPRPGRPTPHPLEERMDGIAAMVAAAGPDRRAQALVGLCGYAGLRVGEAINVKPEHINSRTKMLKIRGKGDAVRNIPLGDKAWAAIAPSFSRGTPGVPLVGWRDRMARRTLTGLAVKAGIQGHISSHQLRATFATCVFEKTLDLRACQELLGHSSSHTTEAYVQASMASLRRGVDL